MDQKYIEAEKRLAELLGWTRLEFPQFGMGWVGIHPKGWGLYTPHWTRDWSACGLLVAEHQVDINWFVDSGVECDIYSGGRLYSSGRQAYEDHPDRDTAVRYAIVQAVIAKLSTKQEG